MLDKAVGRTETEPAIAPKTGPPSLLAGHREIRQCALALLRGNRRQGFDPRYGVSYSYTCPSPGRYRWQWFWDSCFHAIVLSHLDLDQAKAELVSLTAPQEPDGFIGHITYWGSRRWVETWGRLQSRPALRPRHTSLVQPPVLAQAALEVYRRSEDNAFLNDILPRVERYYRWLGEHRDPDKDGLIAIISPYESGMDHKPSYDVVLGFESAKRRSRLALELRDRRLDLFNLRHGFDSERLLSSNRFNVEDVLVNSIYAQGLHALAALRLAAGQPDRSREWTARAEQTERALLTRCYDPAAGTFWDLAGKEETPLRVLTVSSLFPVILPNMPKEVVQAAVSRHLRSAKEFRTAYPVPSVALSEPVCVPGPSMTLWRGPTWINTNWFLAKGLRMHGYAAEAEAIAEASIALVSRQGFREYFNPITGQGMGAKNFGWSTLVVDMMEG